MDSLGVRTKLLTVTEVSGSIEYALGIIKEHKLFRCVPERFPCAFKAHGKYAASGYIINPYVGKRVHKIC